MPTEPLNRLLNEAFSLLAALLIALFILVLIKSCYNGLAFLSAKASPIKLQCRETVYLSFLLCFIIAVCQGAFFFHDGRISDCHLFLEENLEITYSRWWVVFIGPIMAAILGYFQALSSRGIKLWSIVTGASLIANYFITPVVRPHGPNVRFVFACFMLLAVFAALAMIINRKRRFGLFVFSALIFSLLIFDAIALPVLLGLLVVFLPFSLFHLFLLWRNAIISFVRRQYASLWLNNQKNDK